MPKLKVLKPFSWAHRNVDVKSYEKGESIETDDKDLIKVAVEEGWAKADKSAEAAPAQQSEAAPENKDANHAPETA